MKRDYEIIGKISQINEELILKKKLINSSIIKKVNFNPKLLKKILISTLTITAIAILESHGVSAHGVNEFVTVTSQYQKPIKLESIVQFIDWLISLLRWFTTIVVGIIMTYSGYRYSTDISGSGVAEAKKIFKNCIVGLLLVYGGTSLTNFFIEKLTTFL